MKKATAKAEAPKLDDNQFRAISRALADPRRYAILQQVAAAPGGVGCGALHEQENISPATISHHVKELVESGLVEMEREGRCANLSLQRTVWNAYLQRLAAI